MIIFDFRLGRFEFVAQRESVPSRNLFSRPAPGEFIIDLPGVSLMVTYHKARVAAR
ncbi:hypothetical protein KQ247_13990 [Ruegeria pomeroyi]|uniref:Uncharacterized protein n=1 Tax=Ruegeria pomeroyi TaxID=89184 RepID=A0A850LIF7_9RHOB|nr:hypothetical protein [Ruegeria pomeroyi]NVK97487.1 hypothetical protein [Ruegeria pomeroyi]NVL01502.1 hypothetical protein [Ruegeria pomeroyi]QWV07936.1 hypothetical protein KQ247_13990 [Ruegeria pomeroyi]